MMRPLQIINAAGQIANPTLNPKPLPLFIEAINKHLAIITASTKQVRVPNIGGAENPGIISMKSLQTINGFLLVHDPQVDGIIDTRGVKELVGEHINCVNSMVQSIVQQLRVFVNLPEDALPVH